MSYIPLVLVSDGTKSLPVLGSVRADIQQFPCLPSLLTFVALDARLRPTV